MVKSKGKKQRFVKLRSAIALGMHEYSKHPMKMHFQNGIERREIIYHKLVEAKTEHDLLIILSAVILARGKTLKSFIVRAVLFSGYYPPEKIMRLRLKHKYVDPENEYRDTIILLELIEKKLSLKNTKVLKLRAQLEGPFPDLIGVKATDEQLGKLVEPPQPIDPYVLIKAIKSAVKVYLKLRGFGVITKNGYAVWQRLEKRYRVKIRKRSFFRGARGGKDSLLRAEKLLHICDEQLTNKALTLEESYAVVQGLLSSYASLLQYYVLAYLQLSGLLNQAELNAKVEKAKRVVIAVADRNREGMESFLVNKYDRPYSAEVRRAFNKI